MTGPVLDATEGAYRVEGLPSGSFRIHGVAPEYLGGLGTRAPVTTVAVRADGTSFAVGGANDEVIEVDIGEPTVVPNMR